MDAEADLQNSYDDVDDDVKRLLFDYQDKCPVCLEDCCDPKVLPCLHPICLSCLNRLCQNKQPGMSFACPMCRRSIGVSASGSAAFETVRGLGKLAESAAKGSRKRKSSRRQRSAQTGTIVNLPFCYNHQTYRTTFYCNDCDNLCCVICLFQFSHLLHSFSNIEIAAQYLRENLRDLLVSQNSVLQAVEPISSHLEVWKEGTAANVSTVENDIKNELSKVLQMVGKDAEKLLEHIRSSHSEAVDVAGELKTAYERKTIQLKLFVRNCGQVVDKGTLEEVVQRYNELKLEANKLSELLPVRTSDYLYAQWSFNPQNLHEQLPPARRNLVGRVTTCDENYEERRRALNGIRRSGNDANLNESDENVCEIASDDCSWEEMRTQLNETHLTKEKLEKDLAHAEKKLKIRKTRLQETANRLFCAESSRLRERKIGFSVLLLLLSVLAATIIGYQSTVQDLSQSLTELQRELMNVSLSRDELNRVHELEKDANEQTNRIKNTQRITASVATSKGGRPIQKFAPGRRIKAMTILDNDLYLIRSSSVQLEVYDVSRYRFIRNESIDEVVSANDMVSCQWYRCLYIADRGNYVSTIHRLDIDGRLSRDRHIIQWKVDDVPDGMSVSPFSFHLFVTFSQTDTIKEFSTTGELIREIQLVSELKHPFSAIEVSPDRLIVGHGRNSDTVSRVCLLDRDGIIKGTCFGGPKRGSATVLHQPVRIVSYGVNLVADVNSHRIVMLGPELNYIREFIASLDGPERLTFDETSGKLFVADNAYEDSMYTVGQVKVFKM